MYKAIQSETKEEIIILHPAWRGRINELRAMDKAGVLVCQGCGQQLRVKAGEVKRPHFAHKHRIACSLGSESAAILMARATLYEFLLAYFREGVTLEKVLPGTNLPRSVDCWVETSVGSLAYWIVESGIKIEVRDTIQHALAREDIHPTWVMVQAMLQEESKLFHSLLLTPTERAYIQKSAFDEAVDEMGTNCGSLHYLDAEHGVLTTYRNLRLHHRPNWFVGLKKHTPLSDVLVDRRTGGLIHPGEEKRLQIYQRRQQRLADKRQQMEQREADFAINAERHTVEQAATDAWGLSPTRKQMTRETGSSKTLQCALCGCETDDYWMTFFVDDQKMCRCRSCLNKESS